MLTSVSVLTRLLSKDDFGVVALAVAFTSLTTVFANQGFSDALIQRSQIDERHRSSAFWVNVALAVILAAITCLAAPVLASVLEQKKLTAVLIALSPVCIFSACGRVQEALLKRDLQFRKLALRKIVSTLLGIALGIGAAFLGWGVYSLVVQMLAIELVGLMLLWKIADWRPKILISWDAVRELWSFGKHLVILALLTVAAVKVDDLVVGAMLGAVALGVYSIGFTLVRAMTAAFNGVVVKVTFAALAKVQNNHDGFLSVFDFGLRLSSILGVGACLFVWLEGKFIVAVLFGDAWASSASVMGMLAIGAMFSMPSAYCMIALRSKGHPEVNVRYQLGIVIGYAAAAIFGCSLGHVNYVAAGLAIVNLFSLPAALIIFQTMTRYPFHLILRPLLPAAVAGGAMVAVNLIKLNDFGTGISSVLVSIGSLVVYAAVAVIGDSKCGGDLGAAFGGVLFSRRQKEGVR